VVPVKRRRAVYLTQEAIGLLPPLAALGLAGWLQTEIAHAVLGLPWVFAWVPAAAIEGAAAYCAVLYHRHLLAGDSAWSLRLAMLIYAGVSAGLLYWRSTQTGKPWEVAAAVGGLALSALYLWGRRARWMHRQELRRAGRLDKQAVRFSVLRWLMCPVETPGAFRFAVKHSIEDPTAALEQYRSRRTRKPKRTPDPAPTAARPGTSAREAGGTSVAKPDPGPATPVESRLHLVERPRRAPRANTVDLEDLIRTAAGAFPDRLPKVREIEETLGVRSRGTAMKILGALRDARNAAAVSGDG
jgi:hypothetical protein